MSLPAFLWGVASDIADAKTWLVWGLGLSRDALHVHIGLGLLLIAALLLRRRPDDWRCWTIVLAVGVANEVLDALAATGRGQPWVIESMRDLMSTMLWPTMLLLFGRALWRGRPPTIKP